MKDKIEIICQAFNVKPNELYKPSHKANVGNAKKLLVKWYKDITQLSFHQIGKRMNYGHSQPARHGYKQANNLIETEPGMKAVYNSLPFFSSLSHRPTAAPSFPRITALAFRH